MVILAGLSVSPYGRRKVSAPVRSILASHRADAPAPEDLIRDTVYVAFDTETSGTNPNYDRILEIAAVKFTVSEILEERTWLVNPQRFIPVGAQGVHGITPEMVADQPTFAEIYPEFAAFSAGAVLIAYNASFDINFVKMELDRARYPEPRYPVVDCLKLFRNTYPGLESYKLEAVAHEIGVPTEVLHRAADDSRYTGKVLQKIFVRWGEDGRNAELYEAAGGLMGFGEERGS